MRRTLIASSLLLTLTVSAFAQDTALLRCADIANRDARLDCFDALAAKARSAKAAGATPLAQADNFGRDSLPPPPKPAAVPQASPASPAPQAAPAAEAAVAVDSVKSQIDGIVEGWGPGTVFTLANGQRWQVSDGSRAEMYLKSPKVAVKRALLGGYVIELEGTNKTAKVRRFE